jgi:hypothetical protein
VRRVPASTLAAAAFAATAVTAWAATSQTGTPVLATRLNEENPAAAGAYFAYSQNSRKRPRRYDAYVRSGQGRPIKVNAPRTQGWIGGISGTTLVYQQVPKNGHSDLKFFDLATRKRSDAAGFNTRSWEWHPSISGDWVLFGRSSPDVDYTILRSFSTGRQIVLDKKAEAESSFELAPGEVNGDYAVWTKCEHATCAAYRYAIAEGLTTPLPPPAGKAHYAASVDASGTVYVGRSGSGCGNGAEIWRYPLVGLPTLLLKLPRGQDFRFTYATAGSTGATEVYYDRVICRRKAWDVYKVVDSNGPTP